LLSASVNGSLGRSVTAITYDGGSGSGYSAIRAGQTLRLTNSYSTYDVRIVSVTGTQTSGTITVAANDHIWEDNASLIVLEEYRVWPLLPRFTVDGTFYKDWDQTYIDETQSPYPVIDTDHHVGVLPAGGTFDYTEDLNRSYGLLGAVISSSTLIIEPATGVTITDNLDNTYDVSIDTAGAYWQIATVTDDNGKTQTGIRRVFVHDDSYPWYGDVKIGTLAGDSRRGWNMSLEAFGAQTETDLPDEALIIVWQEQLLDGAESYPGARPATSNILFTGYLDRNVTDVTRIGSTLRLQARSVNQVLSDLFIASISLESVGSATTWYQYALGLTTGLGVHHLLRHHTTVMEVATVLDLDSDSGRERYAVQLQAGAVGSSAASLLNSILALFGCDRYGRVRVIPDLQLLGQSARDAVSTTMTLTSADLLSLNLIRQDERAATVFLSGIARSGAGVSSALPLLSRAPGSRYEFGGSTQDVSNLVLIDQDSANELAGRVFARNSQAWGRVELRLKGSYLPALDVIQEEWLALTLDGTETAEAVVWSAQRLLVDRLSVQLGGSTMTVTVSAEPEAGGEDGQTVEYPKNPPGVTDTEDPELPEEPETPDEGDTDEPEILNPPLFGDLVTWGATMGVYWSSGAGDVGWQARNGLLTGGSNPGCVDPAAYLSGESGEVVHGGLPLWRCAGATIHRSADGGATWLDVTPLDDPPNVWGDATAPVVADVTFIRVTASYAAPGYFSVPAIWQEVDSGSGKWRSCLLVTIDYGVSWQWVVPLVYSAETVEFDFAESENGWVGLADYTVGVSGYKVAATTYWDNTKFADKCSGLGPGGWKSDEVGWAGALSEYVNEVRIWLPQKVTFTNINMWMYGNSIFDRYLIKAWESTDATSWTLFRNKALYGGSQRDTCFSDEPYDRSRTDVFLKLGWYNNRSNTPRGAIYTVELVDLTTGPTELRIVYATASWILAIADGELTLYDTTFTVVTKIGDCTDAEYDANTYSAACFAPLDGGLFVFGRFDCTAGDTGLTGVQHIIAYDGSSWTSVESGWSADHCGSFLAGYDSGGGARYWAIRNKSGSCALYSDIGDVGTLVFDDIAAFNVAPDGFHILDGLTMVVAGTTAATGTIVYESYDGGYTWADVTGALPTSGVNKVSYV
jgi:hypothetical protein